MLAGDEAFPGVTPQSQLKIFTGYSRCINALVYTDHKIETRETLKMAYQANLQNWMDMVESGHGQEDLAKLLDDDAVMMSPVVHTPQKGKMITMAYLMAASKTIGNDSFKYVRTFDCGNRAVLEFETVMDGIFVNGVDMIEWNDEGLVTEFKVMLRPLKAVQMVHAQMGAMLEAMKAGKVAE